MIRYDWGDFVVEIWCELRPPATVVLLDEVRRLAVEHPEHTVHQCAKAAVRLAEIDDESLHQAVLERAPHLSEWEILGGNEANHA